jgi:valyl-tRNA synthetase
MPFICEALYLELYAAEERRRQEPGANLSIHTSAWPKPDERLDDAAAVATGELLVEIASAVRRYKSEQNQPLGSEISRLQLASAAQYAQAIRDAEPDLMSITRARLIELVDELNPNYCQIYAASSLQAAVE